jgi:Iap family predicted aminopeptidase
MGFKVYNAMVQFMNEFSHFESHYEDNMQVATIHMNQGSKKNSLMRMLELINGLLEEKALGNM